MPASQDNGVESGTGVPPVRGNEIAHGGNGKTHGRDAHATDNTGGTGVPPVRGNGKTHGRDAHATLESGTGVPPVRGNGKTHGRDAHATFESGTGVPPVRGNGKTHGRDAHATDNTGGTGVPPVSNADHGRAAHATLEIRQGAYLPHWALTHGGIYAVTFRLADSLPRSVLEGLLRERTALESEAIARNGELTQDEAARLAHLHSDKIESYLDAGNGSCWLRQPDIAGIVARAFSHFDSDRYHLHAWCVMPNHVHVLVEPLPGSQLASIVHSWKSYTAKAANKILKRSGEFWQPEYYDHLIRDEADYAHAVRYIEQNPVKAGLNDWRWVSRGTDVPPVGSLEHGRDARATE